MLLGQRATAPSVNIASMRNEGIDIQLINRGKVGGSDVGYEVNVTGSFLNNKIQSLAPGVPYVDQPLGTNRLSLPATRNQPGQSLASFFGYKVIGLFQTKEEIAAAPTQEGAGLGRFRYADVNGDGKITNDDRTFIGSPVPKFTGGTNIRFNYRGFDVATYLYASLGNKIFNMSRWFTDFYPSFSGAAISARVKRFVDAYEYEHHTANFRRRVELQYEHRFPTRFYVENGSYLRMQNITVGYTLPGSVVGQNWPQPGSLLSVGQQRVYDHRLQRSGPRCWRRR